MLRQAIVLSILLSLCLQPALAQQPTPTPNPADKRTEQLEEAQRRAEADKRADKWDVEGDHGPTTKVEFDTDEGTWMSCDVSPDGASLIFDLLGDLYRMPVGGGRAELLSGGVSWESQPRYSPDGKSIAFTSDRDGGDNIWLMDADGRNRRQLTKETLRLVNSPAWTPDGQYVLVRKHFVDQRSLGAGEIWMYHVGGGGTGVQLTEKTSWTANVGEPVSDPQKRFIYFVNSGDFDYNKNVYDSIYWIERYDIERGRRGVFVRGAGGAVRPQISPDDKLLAFIRRDRLKTALYLREIESGREWPVYDKLTRDQQETWAVYGTYPGYSWTPDGKSIVITAGGKFVRVDVATKGATPVPFTARVSQRVSEAVRFPQKVFTERDRTHLHRWAKRANDRIVYSALGKIYLKQGDAAPARLLNSNQLEYSPNFSPDGRQITFVTWSDAEKGAVWIAEADGANPRKITDKPDQYANPAFSPDGRKLAYLKGRGNVNHEEELVSESAFEIHYWDGQQSRYVMDLQSRGANARMPILSFDPAGERIFFLESPPPTPATPPGQPAQIFSALSSVKISGDDYKRHVEAKFATEIIPSPDHNWVFFKELHKLYLAPFPRTGKTLKMNSTETILPVKSISKNSGDWLAWSPDSKSVQWTLGENFHEQTLEQINRQLAKDEKPAEPKATRIGFEFESARPRGSVALTNARIITMKGDEVIERGTILVEGNRIKAVGARVQIPAGARRIDMAGKTIAPGLIDVHAHMGYNTLDIIPEKQWPYWANLAYGVTTTHDPSAATQSVFAQSEMVKAGLMVGPRIFSTGYPVYGAESPEKAPVNNLEDARGHLARLKAVGAFSVKSYNQPRRNQRQQIIQAARELKMMVVPEGGSTYFYNMTHILDGHTGIEHAIPIAPLYKDAVMLFAKSRSGYTPTLVVGYGGVWGENYWYQKSNVWENEKLLRFTPRSTIDPRARRRTMTPEDDFYHFELAKTVKDVVRAGGRAQLGSHGQLQGLGAHWELWMLQQGGLTPLEALRAATLSGAQYLGLDGEVGSIETGKLADLMITDKNPLDNVQNSETISFVMMNGVLYDTRNMDEVYPQARPRGKFFWER
ncbi:MAG TPA: amidohydrolase family protein [Pyrinomonadaceae bacterium]|nr:amidohydrolase family protein [Pyrinomonadaceae bacterium]